MPPATKPLKRQQTPAQKAANAARRKYALSQKRGKGGKFETIKAAPRGPLQSRGLPLKLKNILLKETAPAPTSELGSMSHPVVNMSPTRPHAPVVKTRKKDDPTASFHLSRLRKDMGSFWQQLVREGSFNLDLKTKAPAVLAILGSSILLTLGSFLVGRASTPETKIETRFVPIVTPTPGVVGNPLERTFAGTLRRSNVRYYLQNGDETITIEAPMANLTRFVGRRVLARGEYQPATGTLTVMDTTRIEVLPDTSQKIPTVSPIPAIQESTRDPFAPTRASEEPFM